MARDPYDFLDRIDAQVEFERRQKMIDAGKAQAAIDDERARVAKARTDAMTQRANVSFRLHEYAVAGVAPPFTDGKGNPTVSLSLLLQMGWEIKNLGDDQRVLVKPETFPPGRLQSQV